MNEVEDDKDKDDLRGGGGCEWYTSVYVWIKSISWRLKTLNCWLVGWVVVKM